MGIFDRLFRPDVDKLKEKQDVKGLIRALKHKDWFVREKAADALVDMRDKNVVDPLLGMLRKWQKNKSLEIQFIDTIRFALGRMGDLRAGEEVIKSLLKRPPIFFDPVITWTFGPVPNEEKKVLEIISKSSIGGVLFSGDPDIIIGKEKEMEMLRTKETFEPLLLIRLTSSQKKEEWVKKASQDLASLFGDYTDMLIQLSIIEAKIVEDYREGDVYKYELTQIACIRATNPKTSTTVVIPVGIVDYKWYVQGRNYYEAIKKLCEIRTPVSTNILNLIVKEREPTRRIISKIIPYSSGGEIGEIYHYGDLNFRDLVEIAEEELKRRGKPHYDPSVFLSKEAWKL